MAGKVGLTLTTGSRLTDPREEINCGKLRGKTENHSGKGFGSGVSKRETTLRGRCACEPKACLEVEKLLPGGFTCVTSMSGSGKTLTWVFTST